MTTIDKVYIMLKYEYIFSSKGRVNTSLPEQVLRDALDCLRRKYSAMLSMDPAEDIARIIELIDNYCWLFNRDLIEITASITMLLVDYESSK